MECEEADGGAIVWLVEKSDKGRTGLVERARNGGMSVWRDDDEGEEPDVGRQQQERSPAAVRGTACETATARSGFGLANFSVFRLRRPPSPVLPILSLTRRLKLSVHFITRCRCSKYLQYSTRFSPSVYLRRPDSAPTITSAR